MKIVYITSSSYSGSTLLSFVLNAHPKVGTISEYDIMVAIQNDPDYLCSCGQRIWDCGFFGELSKRMNADGVVFELDNMDLMFNVSNNERLNRYLTQKLPLIHSTRLELIREKIFLAWPPYARFMRRMHRRNALFMKHVIELQQAQVFLDANKNPYRVSRLAEQHTLVPIYLYKNGIGGAYSLHKKAKLSNPKARFRESCDKWFLEQITINRVLNQVSAKSQINLSYGEMCGETQKSTDRIYLACGLEPVDTSKFSEVEHHIIGNKMRVTAIDKIKEITDWKENLSPSEFDTYMSAYRKFMPKLISFNPEIEAHIWRQ